jgi:hypothetical protein
MLRLTTCAVLLFGLLGSPVIAADKIVRELVSLPARNGETLLKATVKGYGSHEYLVDGKTGQWMTVRLQTSNSSTYFNVWSPGKTPGQDEAIFIGDVSGDVFSQKLPESGSYLVQVYLYRNAARRNEESSFTVNIALKDDQAETAPEGDFADGLMGGPDFWEVQGLAPGKTVNMRREAAKSSDVVDRLAMGTILRNKGCKMNGTQRWCNVERRDNAAISGWVAGQFLRESAASGGASPDDALVPGTDYHATGRIPCALDGQPDVKDCEFGVTRGSPGIATVFITVPNGFVRVLAFDNGKVAPQSSVTSFEFSRDQDNTLVKVNGQDESYTIPDAVIFGG